MPNTGGNLTPDGTAYVHNLSPYLNHPNPDNMLGTILAADTSVTPSVIDPSYVGIYGGALMTSTTANSDAVSSNTTPFTAPGTGISITQGTSLVTLVGGVWPALYKYAGLSINFNGYSFVVLSHGALGIGTGLDLNGAAIALSNVQLLIMGVYEGPTLTNVPYTITGCQVQMTASAGNDVNTLTTVNTNPAAPPPGVALGYSQMTASNLVQVKVRCIRANGSLPESRKHLYRSDWRRNGRDFVPTGYMLAAARGSISQWAVAEINPLVSTDVGKTIIVDQRRCGGTMLVTTISTIITVLAARFWRSPNASGAHVVSREPGGEKAS